MARRRTALQPSKSGAKTNKKVTIDRSAFLDTVKAIVESSPECTMSVEEVVEFRNDMLYRMCEGVHTSFEGRIGAQTAAKNMYETATNLTLMVLGEQLPSRDKIDIEEKFEEEKGKTD